MFSIHAKVHIYIYLVKGEMFKFNHFIFHLMKYLYQLTHKHTLFDNMQSLGYF